MTTSFAGSVVHRVEDPRLLTGRPRYTDTMRPEDALQAVFVRSMMAHGRPIGIDAAQEATMPGVGAP